MSNKLTKSISYLTVAAAIAAAGVILFKVVQLAGETYVPDVSMPPEDSE